MPRVSAAPGDVTSPPLESPSTGAIDDDTGCNLPEATSRGPLPELGTPRPIGLESSGHQYSMSNDQRTAIGTRAKVRRGSAAPIQSASCTGCWIIQNR